MFKLADLTYKAAKRLVISVVGFTVLLIGVAMLVLPGPAMVVIPLGLAILGAEFAWARRFLQTIREKGTQAFSSMGSLLRARRAEREAGSADAPGGSARSAAGPESGPADGADGRKAQDPGSRTTGS
jgi:uncharacterized protein (TIGR02611 family)